MDLVGSVVFGQLGKGRELAFLICDRNMQEAWLNPSLAGPVLLTRLMREKAGTSRQEEFRHLGAPHQHVC